MLLGQYQQSKMYTESVNVSDLDNAEFLEDNKHVILLISTQ